MIGEILQEEEKLEYCVFEKDGLDDFRNVILPNVWEQLALTENYDVQGLRLIGALSDGKPVGALVARCLEQEEVYIHSIYVTGEYRSQGIGSRMVKKLIEMTSNVYRRSFSPDFPLFFHLEYTLPEEDCPSFEKFLKKQGFCDFREKKRSYLFERSELKLAAKKYGRIDSEVRNLTRLKCYDSGLFADTFEAAGFTGDPALCFIHGDEENADFIAAAISGEEEDFYLFTNSGGTEITTKTSEDTVMALINTLCRDYRNFSLIVDGESNEALPLWQQLIQYGGTICRRQEAGMYLVFKV